VGSAATDDAVVAARALQRVIADAAVDQVGANAAVDQVGANAAGHHVIAGAAVEGEHRHVHDAAAVGKRLRGRWIRQVEHHADKLGGVDQRQRVAAAAAIDRVEP